MNPSLRNATLTVALSLAVGLTAPAHAGLKRVGAGQSPSTKVTVETYSAVDASPEAAPADDLTSQVHGASAGAPPAIRRAARKARAAKAAPAADLASSEDPGADASATPVVADAPRGYDFLPEVQARAIAKRLKLVESLLIRHQRAYDYRSYTVAQLQAIYAKLEAERELFEPPASIQNSPQ